MRKSVDFSNLKKDGMFDYVQQFSKIWEQSRRNSDLSKISHYKHEVENIKLINMKISNSR
jgi:hypothetical protein